MTQRKLSEPVQIVCDNPDLGTEDMIAKLKEHGYSYDKKAVLQARWRLKKREETQQPSRGGAHAGASQYGKPRPSSAAAFIVTLPSTLTNEEAFERVVAEGYDVSMHAVYSARKHYPHLLKKEGRGKQRVPKVVAETVENGGALTKAKPAANGSAVADLTSRQQLVAQIMRLGLEESRAVFGECEALMERFSRG